MEVVWDPIDNKQERAWGKFLKYLLLLPPFPSSSHFLLLTHLRAEL